jgi:hypothetical protein
MLFLRGNAASSGQSVAAMAFWAERLSSVKPRGRGDLRQGNLILL